MGKKRGRKPDPVDDRQWQEAVDAAEFCLGLVSCHMYGLIESSMFEKDTRRRPPSRGWYGRINLGRAEYLLAKGAARGVHPILDRHDPILNPIEAAAAAALEQRKETPWTQLTVTPPASAASSPPEPKRLAGPS